MTEKGHLRRSKTAMKERDEAREAADLRYHRGQPAVGTVALPHESGTPHVRRVAWRPSSPTMTGDGPNLYHGNMWSPKPEDKKEEFSDYRAIIDAGWQVD